METSPKMSVQNLDFFYGDFHALKEIALDFEVHRVTALIGPVLPMSRIKHLHRSRGMLK